MRQPGTITIIATVREGMEERLRDYLKLRVDMNEDGTPNDVDFLQMGDLHFCAMFIVDADQILEKPALLVIEVTIDGDTREFLENMIEVSPVAFANILECCEGFPASSLRLGRLVVDYLMLRIVRYKTHYCGYPGRTVAQIKGEQKLRDSLRSLMNEQNRKTNSEPPTFSQIHRNMKLFVRNHEALNWAVHKPAQIDVIKFRHRNILALAAILVTVPAIFILIWSFRLWSVSPSFVFEQVSTCVGSLQIFSIIDFRSQNCFILPDFFPKFLGWFTKSLSAIFLVFVICWVGSNILRSIFGNYKQQHRKAFSLEITDLSITIVNLVSLVCLLLLGYLIFLQTLNYFGVFDSSTNGWHLVGFLIALGASMLFFSILGSITSKNSSAGQYNTAANGIIKTMIKSVFGTISFAGYKIALLASAFVALSLFLSFVWGTLDWVQLAWSSLFSLFGVEISPIPWAGFFTNILVHVHDGLKILTLAALSILPFLVAAILLLIAIIIVVLVLAQIMEMGDRFNYRNCETLTGNRGHDQKQSYAREEHGYNTNQNHLISVVHVKKGLLRRTLLRVTFWIINLLAEIVFNRGTLGGIPTIMSARWMLIDKGARIIFMTNYVGAWDSYINEFLDLEGVRGVNAIWSNTAQPDPDDPSGKKLVAFPNTRFLLWNGAENEKQFKAYIRNSQVETLVWYGAYPDLSVSNINNNSALRDSLFEDLTTAQMDELVSRL